MDYDSTAYLKNDGSMWRIDRYGPAKIMDNVVALSHGTEISAVITNTGEIRWWNWSDYYGNEPLVVTETFQGGKIPQKNSFTASAQPSNMLNGTKVLLNGEELKFESPIINKNNTNFYPMRQLFNALGTEVSWNEAERTAKGTLGDNSVEFTIDKAAYSVNSSTKSMEAAAFIQNGSTYIPIRYAAEGLGFAVEWNGDTNTISISK